MAPDKKPLFTAALLVAAGAVATVAIVVALDSSNGNAPPGHRAGVSTSVDSDARSLLSQGWTTMQQAAAYKKWKTQNPGESTKLESYWANGGVAPTLATLFGQAKTLDGQAYHTLSPAPPPTDTTPPTVSLTSPTNGSTVSGTINVAATAADNVGVTKVEFSRDGSLFATDSAAPYTVAFNTTTIANGAHTFSPRAYDGAGNTTVGTASAVTVSNVVAGALCADGIDNDGDGKIDLADPGCSSATDNDETDPAPAGSVFVSPSGNDSNSCTQSAPCRTFNRGYQVAQAGQTVTAAVGDYGDQTIGAATKASTVILDATGSTAGNVAIRGATNLEIRGLAANEFYVGENSASAAGQTKSITLRNVDTRYFFGRSVIGFHILNSRIGGTQDGASATVGAAYESSVMSRDVVFDNVVFHDIGRADNPSGHVECFYAAEIDGLTIHNSQFVNCGIFDLMFDTITCGTCVARNVTITGTEFGTTTPSNYGLFFKTNPPVQMTNYLIENNWFREGTGFSDTYASSLFNNFVVRGNYGTWSSGFMLSGITFDNNHFGQSPPAGWPG